MSTCAGEEGDGHNERGIIFILRGLMDMYAGFSDATQGARYKVALQYFQKICLKGYLYLDILYK